VVVWLAFLSPGHAAAATLAAATTIDLSGNPDVTDAVIARLPPTLRALNVSKCKNLTRNVSFTHLTALESLDCSNTHAVDAGVASLPPSLQQLRMGDCNLLPTANFSQLTALRVTVLAGTATKANKAMLDSLPPSLEELDVSSWPPGASLTHLPRLRVLRAAHSYIDGAALAMLPPTLVELNLDSCRGLSSAASFARFPHLRTLAARHTELGNAALASLPPSLVSLDLSGSDSKPSALTAAALFSHLPVLRVLDVSRTAIGDASVASMPAGLEVLHMSRCGSVTQRASLDHLAALRKLDSCGTDLPRATLAACRARGCVAPADGVVSTDSFNGTFALLPNGRLVNTHWVGNVALWDTAHCKAPVATKSLSSSFVFTYRFVSALAVLPDNRRVAVGMTTVEGEKGAVWVWDTRGASHDPGTIKLDTSVDALVVLPDGDLVAGGSRGSLYVIDPYKGDVVVGTQMNHSGAVTALVVLPGGGLASASKDGTVQLWDVAARTCVGHLEGHTDGATALVALPDGLLACGSGDGAVRLWDVGRRVCVGTLSGLVSKVCALTVLADNRLAGVTADGVVCAWDTREGTAAGTSGESALVPTDTFVVPTTTERTNYGLPVSLATLPDGRLATSGGGLHLWQLPVRLPATRHGAI